MKYCIAFSYMDKRPRLYTGLCYISLKSVYCQDTMENKHHLVLYMYLD
jgi:hypothetical protein